MKTRYAKQEDKQILLRMRTELWPGSAEEHAATLDAYFDGTPTFIDQIVVCADAASLVGFAELRIRNYAEGSDNLAVPYLEGWFVDAAWRGKGFGKTLITGAEEWARSRGYTELASDAQISNHGSIHAHLALGFEEVERSVCFLKRL